MTLKRKSHKLFIIINLRNNNQRLINKIKGNKISFLCKADCITQLFMKIKLDKLVRIMTQMERDIIRIKIMMMITTLN